jgi:hypothetical protein
MKCPFSIYKFPKTLAIFSISDIDECSEATSNDCDLNATCINTNASYNCTCNIGFTGNGKECSGKQPCMRMANLIFSVIVGAGVSVDVIVALRFCCGDWYCF